MACTYNPLPLVLGDDKEQAASIRQHSMTSLFDRLEELDSVEPRESDEKVEFISIVTGIDDNDSLTSRGGGLNQPTDEEVGFKSRQEPNGSMARRTTAAGGISCPEVLCCDCTVVSDE